MTAAPIFDVTTTVNQKQFSQELQVNGSLGPLSLTAGTYYYDEDIDYTLTADILPGMYGFLVNAGICPSAPAPCFAATRGFRQPPTFSLKAYAGFGQGPSIGIASCRERVCPYDLIAVVAVSFHNNPAYRLTPP